MFPEVSKGKFEFEKIQDAIHGINRAKFPAFAIRRALFATEQYSSKQAHLFRYSFGTNTLGL